MCVCVFTNQTKPDAVLDALELRGGLEAELDGAEVADDALDQGPAKVHVEPPGVMLLDALPKLPDGWVQGLPKIAAQSQLVASAKFSQLYKKIEKNKIRFHNII